MLLDADSVTWPDGSDVKVMKPPHFRIRRNWAAVGNCLAVRACSSFRGRVESSSTELKCLAMKYRPLEQSATNLVTCIIESYPLSK